jgi:hypothetical protein
LISKENDNRGISIEYSQIKEEEKHYCEYITQMYNTCIDADNLLFPHSDYNKCFSENNSIYFCNKIEKYNDKEKELVSNILN